MCAGRDCSKWYLLFLWHCRKTRDCQCRHISDSKHGYSLQNGKTTSPACREYRIDGCHAKSEPGQHHGDINQAWKTCMARDWTAQVAPVIPTRDTTQNASDVTLQTRIISVLTVDEPANTSRTATWGQGSGISAYFSRAWKDQEWNFRNMARQGCDGSFWWSTNRVTRANKTDMWFNPRGSVWNQRICFQRDLAAWFGKGDNRTRSVHMAIMVSSATYA